MCYHPNILKYQKNSVVKKDGTIGNQKCEIIFANSPKFKGYEYYLNEDKRLSQNTEYGRYGYKLIPCGKCLSCRIKQTKEWAIRIELEAKKYKYNYFITLTYNDENLYIPEEITTKDGETYYNDGTWKGSLNKKDLQQFIKSVRNWFKREYNHNGVKFYACGEYGSSLYTNRPHYHIILMNCPEIELEPIGQNRVTKHGYYTNQRMEQIWHKGYITIGKVNWDTASYTAGYCQKKLFGEIKEKYYAEKGQIPIFSTMSRRPGIGKSYYDEHKNQIYELDEIINGKGKSIKPPKYFDRLMENENQEIIENVKEYRQYITEKEQEKKYKNTNLTMEEQLKVEEKEALHKQKLFNRERI